ncbi:MAG: Trk family potassium uptake protein [Clostridia bacterium]|nr:Trk family potassium uptake protein [Clostridia bacterium]
MTTWQVLSLGYLIVIITGTLLLLLPFASKSGESTSFINSAFTATSATCVTGLIPYDTNTHWSLFGQIVILSMIQLGGLGFMTVVTLLFRLVGKRMSLGQQKILMASTGKDRRAEMRRLFKRILWGTLLFEGVGALLLSIRFCDQFGAGKGIYYAIFHSISAFCNAGFDLMGGVFGGEKFVSLTPYATDPLVCLTIAFLILIGGLGFCVWDDLLENKFRYKKLLLHTKIVLFSTLFLLVVPTALFLLFERANPDYTQYNFWERVLVAFFSAVTPRTAGFSTVDLSVGVFSDSSYLLTLILMFIGGGSASTAGGVKITTAFVILAGIVSVFRGKRDIELGKRRIHNSVMRQALAVFVSCLIIVLTATLFLCTLERDNSAATLQAVLFESFSAMGTVGLSMGLTPTLCTVSKIVLILLMYIGRVGIVTLGLTFAERKDTAKLKKPVDDSVLIG